MSKVHICKRCVMDDVNTDIIFDKKGICNYCTDALDNKDYVWHKDGQNEFQKIVDKMKRESRNKKYDCVLGLSGGIDSCYVAYLLKKYDLRVLAVHVDAGWDTEVSTENIKNLCKKLDLKLETIKIDYNEMYDLQRAYFLSQVPDQDVPQDHVFFAELYRYALKYGIKYFISGGNFSSECILPSTWGFNAMDGKNLKDIHKKYGKLPLKQVKPLSFYEIYVSIPYIKRLKKIRPLNYIDYNKEKAIKELHDKFGFEYYGGKHCESSFTRLYQGYILPKKFGIVKKKAHLSSLIVAGQMTRNDAITELKKDDYPKKQLEEDIQLFIKNIGITRKEFDDIMSSGVINKHSDFKNFSRTFSIANKIRNIFIKKHK